jgi:hypothetical protein
MNHTKESILEQITYHRTVSEDENGYVEKEEVAVEPEGLTNLLFELCERVGKIEDALDPTGRQVRITKEWPIVDPQKPPAGYGCGLITCDHKNCHTVSHEKEYSYQEGRKAERERILGEIMELFNWFHGLSSDGFPERKEGDGLFWWRRQSRDRFDKLISRLSQDIDTTV